MFTSCAFHAFALKGSQTPNTSTVVFFDVSVWGFGRKRAQKNGAHLLAKWGDKDPGPTALKLGV